ncbi:MAG: flagellar protein FlgN [Comamonas sp.]
MRHDTPPANTALLDELAQHLRSETAHVAEFLQVLGGEARLLASGHRPEAMHKAVRDKQAIVAVLEADEERRRALLIRLGLPADDAAQAASFDVLAQRHEALAGPWRDLRERARAAGDLNRRNGAMLAVHAKHVEGALADIRQARSQSVIYDARGRARKLG